MSALEAANKRFEKFAEEDDAYRRQPIEVLMKREASSCCFDGCTEQVVLVHSKKTGRPFFVNAEPSTSLTPRFTVEMVWELEATKVDAFDAGRGVAGYPLHRKLCKGDAS